MKFSDQLNEYIERVGCTAKALAEAAEVSDSQLSRWRAGARTPDEAQLAKLSAGLAALSGGSLDEEDVLRVLGEALPEEPDFAPVAENLNLLLTALDIRTAEIARSLSFDASYLSRIRQGQRVPARIDEFVDGVARYAVRRADTLERRASLAALIGVKPEALRDNDACRRAVAEWLYRGKAEVRDDVGEFLRKLDEFDLDEYIRAIRFDEMKAPTAPFQLPTSRYYRGVDEMMDGELAFLRSTVLSRSVEPVVMYSEMPMEEKSEDAEFPKKWMFGMAMMLKRGLHLDMIHRVDRPFHELMLGLEGWIPMYMTGQISPWYLKNSGKGPFLHLLWVSGAAALSGEAIAGHYAEGRYRLTKNREELGYYRARADALLQRASPLMDIYREDREADFLAFLRAEEAAGHVPQMLPAAAFRNIGIRVCHGRWAVVSKEKAPHIHFVIRHPRLVDAIENFSPPVVEE